MNPADMQDEINRLVLLGIEISVIDGKVGLVGQHRRIYNFTTNEVITRFKIRNLD